MSAGDTTTKPAGQERSVARLAAVQALYQMELSGSALETVIEEFLAHRIGREIEGAHYAEADRKHFKWLVRNVNNRMNELDGCVGGALNTGWTVSRLGALMRALLRAAAVELLARPDIPARVVMNEYVELAGAFFSRREPAFVNAALDTLARRLRAGEFASPDSAGGDVRSSSGR
ncbi:MAG: transcription antitermination factor NusB [Alphaproteobacteria bacterium]